MTHWIDTLKERHSGRFLEPKDGPSTIRVKCAVHGYICNATLGAEIWCPGCREWIDTLKVQPDGQEIVGKPARRLAKADAMKRRMARKARKPKSASATT